MIAATSNGASDPSAVTQPRSELAVGLADGRTIGVAEFGAPDGFAILWFHGTPGARRQIPPMAAAHAEAIGVRIIGVERPGVGWSTPHHYDRMLDWADDVAEVVDRLGIDAFGVIGLSGGGPYALATAAGLGDRVAAVAVLGGVAPTIGAEAPPGGIVQLARQYEPVLRLLREPLAFGLDIAVKAASIFATPLSELYIRFGPAADREVIGRPEMRAMFVGDIVNAARSQFKALVYDVVLFGRHWGFEVADIDVPVFFWHGDADFFVPLEHGQLMAELVADSRFHFQPGAGHLGTLDAACEACDLIVARHHARSR